MKNFSLAIALFILSSGFTNAAQVDSLKFGNFGEVYVYTPRVVPDAIVLFVSGDGGWNPGIIKIGMKMVDQGSLVVGIDIRRYMATLKEKHTKCLYPASDFEILSLYLQKKYHFKDYLKPILMGYSSGATLVYGILLQAPANTFKGAISMGFCPDIESAIPLCSGNELKQHILKPGISWYLESTDNLTAPFIVINGKNDKTCLYRETEAFMKKVKNSEFFILPNIAHNMSVQKNYLPFLIYAYNKVKNSASYSEMVSAKHQSPSLQKIEKPVTGLPLIILPVAKSDTMPLLVFISGDGGWTSFDESVAENLVNKGIPVIGLDSQKYFWQARTPDETTAELTKVLHHYLTAWNKKSFVLCGYSFGADLIPFVVNRLPGDLKYRLKSAVMMSPDPKADFEIHVSDMLSFGSSSDKYNVLPELKKCSAGHKICIFGKEEDSETPKQFGNAGANVRLLPGGHHFNNDYNAIASEIIGSFH
jgi:type IV secretory pathway VirJ component